MHFQKHHKFLLLTNFALSTFYIFIVFLPIFGNSCAATASSGAPIGNGCCPQLTQTITNNTQFADGVMTFVYDNNNCRTQVTATCSCALCLGRVRFGEITTGGDCQPNPTLQLNAAIVANTNNFLTVGSMTTSFPGTCNANNQWQMGNPPLVIVTLECLLTNPNQG